MEELFKRWLPEVVLSMIGGLMWLVRTGDVRRIETMEGRLDDLEKTTPALVQRMEDKLDAFAKEARSDRAELQRQILNILERKLV